LPASTQYFEQLFYNQQRRLRPRLGRISGNVLSRAATIYLAGSSSGPAPIPTARSMLVEADGNVSIDFQYSPSDPISASWTNLNSPYPAGDIEVYDFESGWLRSYESSQSDTTNNIIYFTGPTYQENPDFGFIATHR